MKFLNEEINLKKWIVWLIIILSVQFGVIVGVKTTVDDDPIQLIYCKTVEEVNVAKQALKVQDYWKDNDLKIKAYLENTIITRDTLNECHTELCMQRVEYPYDLIIDNNTVVFEDYKIVYEEHDNIVQVIVYSDYDNYKITGKGGTLILKTYFELIE